MGSPFSAAEQAYLQESSSVLHHMMRENEEASSYRLAMDHGTHHGLTVVLAGTQFFYSSSLPRA